jgi:hypothetical protein
MCPTDHPEVRFTEERLAEGLATMYHTKIRKMGFASTGRALAAQYIDAPPEQVSLFLKQQVVKKVEKYDTLAFPGQTITAKSALANAADDAMAYVFQRLIVDLLPTNVHYCLDDTDTEVKDRLSALSGAGGFTNIDYTRWDSGVCLGVHSFYAYVFDRLGFPISWTRDWLLRTVSARSHLGHTMPHQESGNRFTLIHNTFGNHMITHATMQVNATSELYKGDDSLLDGTVVAKPNAPRFLAVPRAITGPVVDFVAFTVGAGPPHLSSQKLFKSVLHYYTRGATLEQITAYTALLDQASPDNPDTHSARDLLSRMMDYAQATIRSRSDGESPVITQRARTQLHQFDRHVPIGVNFSNHYRRRLIHDIIKLQA